MTGPEHYREAERLAQRADEIAAEGVRLNSGDPLLLLAQVHATLALAAATDRHVSMSAPSGQVASSWRQR